jgi:hypothetical protein
MIGTIGKGCDAGPRGPVLAAQTLVIVLTINHCQERYVISSNVTGLSSVLVQVATSHNPAAFCGSHCVDLATRKWSRLRDSNIAIIVSTSVSVRCGG